MMLSGCAAVSAADDLAGGGGGPRDAALVGEADLAGGVDAGAGTDASAPGVHTGVLVGGTGATPGLIGGVHFSSGGQSGFTDGSGTFSYEDGQPLTFSVGDVTMGPIAGAPLLSPFALAGSVSCAIDQPLEDLLVLLYSLDGDHDPATGTQLPSFAATGTPLPLASLTPASLAQVLATLAPGVTPIGERAALHLFITQVDGEEWAETGSDTFTGSAAAQRSQGVTTDGVSFLFSWRFGLERTSPGAAFSEQASNQLAIPLQFGAQGSDHIGDIDFWNGKIYAPVEDSAKYAMPMILLYDPADLSYTGQSYALPPALQTAGVPWVAVDGPRARVITAEWDPTLQLNLFDLNGLAVAGSLPLSRTLGRIQGAKVYGGMLYAQADDTQKTTWKINLETGTVITLFTLGRTDVEAEGLVLWQTGGALMHTLNTNAAKDSMELHHHKRTRDPLRLVLCP